jgi:short chain dehydrogenase
VTDQDPTQTYQAQPGAEQIEHPGRTADLDLKPDHGEDTYTGSGRLVGGRALVTSGDSGIGRAVALAFAREGADVVVVHLPGEEEDGEETVRLVEQAGREGVAIVGDLREEDVCGHVVERTVSELGGLDLLVHNAAYQLMQPGGSPTCRASSSTGCSGPTSTRCSGWWPHSRTCSPARASSSPARCRPTSRARS